MSQRHLLVVDDDDRLRDLIREFLARAGFRVSAAPDAPSARRLMQGLNFDLLVVDVMMPGEDGFSLTRSIRARSLTPILMLTARGDPSDRIEGLSLGADDYLAKPFEPQELLLRIEAILRRAGARAAASGKIALGAFCFDPGRGELFDGETPVRLTEGETRLLRRLAQTPDAPVDRYELTDEADGGRAVDVQVTRLRRKIEPDPSNPRYLKTVRGVGYLLAPD